MKYHIHAYISKLFISLSQHFPKCDHKFIILLYIHILVSFLKAFGSIDFITRGYYYQMKSLI